MKGRIYMNYIPLNGPASIRAVERALSGAGFNRTESVVPLIRQTVEPEHPETNLGNEAPDGTNGDAMPFGQVAAIDPSQGHGSHHRPKQDPLMEALKSLPTMTGLF